MPGPKSKAKPPTRIPESEWKWYGNAGHLCIGNDCRFHLCTQVGDYLVSTVGQYVPGESIREALCKARGIVLEGMGDARMADYMKKVGFQDIGASRKYETFVFRAGKKCSSKACGCGLPAINGHEIVTDRYNEAHPATQGHMEMCQKVADPAWIRKQERE